MSEEGEALFEDEIETTVAEWQELDFCQTPDENPERKFTLTVSHKQNDNKCLFITLRDAHLSLQPPIVDIDFVCIRKEHVPNLIKALQNYVENDISQS